MHNSRKQIWGYFKVVNLGLFQGRKLRAILSYHTLGLFQWIKVGVFQGIKLRAISRYHG